MRWPVAVYWVRDVLVRRFHPDGNVANRFEDPYTLYCVAPVTAVQLSRMLFGGSSVRVRPRGAASGQFDRKLHGFGTGPATRGRPTKSVPPVISAVYCVHCVNAVVWARVSTVFVGVFHEGMPVMPPLIVHPTEAMFIASLNVTTMFAVRGTPVAPLAGSVVTMNGLIPTLWKLHGFGTGPGTSRFPEVSRPAVTWTVYVVSSVNGVEWLIVRTVFPGFQVSDLPTKAGAAIVTTVPTFIPWLNVMTMSAASGTFVDAFAGFVFTITGFVQKEKNRHGFGTGPATRGRPWSSWPEVISTW